MCFPMVSTVFFFTQEKINLCYCKYSAIWMNVQFANLVQFWENRMYVESSKFFTQYNYYYFVICNDIFDIAFNFCAFDLLFDDII